MRDLNILNKYRDRSGHAIAHFGSIGDHTSGCFFVPSPMDGAPLCVIASSGEGWDHVSVSRRNRCPNWPEMDGMLPQVPPPHAAAVSADRPAYVREQ